MTSNCQELRILYRLPTPNLLQGEDVVALVVLDEEDNKVLTAVNTLDRKGVIKVFTADLTLLYEFTAHPHPIYAMTSAEAHSQFFTSCSDCTIVHWVEVKGTHCECLNVIYGSDIDMREPAWRLRYSKDEGLLYSGDSTGTVRMWNEMGELCGALGTVEEVWDMQVQSGVLYTTRNLDVYLTTLRNRKGAECGSHWSIKNTLEGTGPLLVMGEVLVIQSRSDYKLYVHSLTQARNPRLAILSGHEAIITAIVGDGKAGVIYSGGYDSTVIAWSSKTFDILGKVKVHGFITAMVLNQKTGVVYAGGQDRFICALKLS